jgi:hypothetical protein
MVHSCFASSNLSAGSINSPHTTNIEKNDSCSTRAAVSHVGYAFVKLLCGRAPCGLSFCNAPSLSKARRPLAGSCGT